MPMGVPGQIKDDSSRLMTSSNEGIRSQASADRKSAVGVARLTIIAVTCMAAGKLIIGILVNSIALISEGIHTLLDLFAAIVSYFTVRVASEPADFNHRYGHGKIENAAGIAQAAFIFFPTALIVYRSIRKILFPGQYPLVHEGMGLGTGIMFATMVVNVLLAIRLLAVSKATKSEAIRAAAYHQLNDLWTSIGVLIALVLIWWKPEWEILDPVVALVVTLISVWMAWVLFKESFFTLLDTSAGGDVDKSILKVLEGYKPVVQNYYNLRTRKAGSRTFIDIRVVMCGNLSFKEGHDITEEIEEAIRREIPNSDVIIHPDPCDDTCQHCDDAYGEWLVKKGFRKI